MTGRLLILAAVVVGAAACPTAAQQNPPEAPKTVQPERVRIDNPVQVADDASRAVGIEGGLSSTINVMILLTVLTLAPSILIMTTSFIRIVVVLALLRQAIGTQSLPPTQIISGLALFMTFMIMAPTFERINEVAIVPMSAENPDERIDQMTAWQRAKQPMRDFMFAQIRNTGNEGDLYMILNYRGVDTSRPEELTEADVDLLTLVPAYVLSELKTAFLIGFRIYLPFLIIDMVVASLLISMGMLMLPPVFISLPFKLLLFVLVDGWRLVVGNLLDSFVQPESVETVMGLWAAVT